MPESSTQVNMVPPWGCNICLEQARDPVCTSCGHIFCWPCLYPWVHDMGNPCPVCRTPLSLHSNIVAVYATPAAQPSGEGNSSIPPRPHPAVIRPPPQPPRPHYFAGEDQLRVIVTANRGVPTHPHQVTRRGPILVAPPQPHLVSRPREGPDLVIDPPRPPPGPQIHFGASRELQFRRRVSELQLQRSFAELEEFRNAELEQQHRVTSRRRSHASRFSSHRPREQQH